MMGSPPLSASLLAVLLTLWIQQSVAFLPVSPVRSLVSSTTTTRTAFFLSARNKKMSMAEKRKQRAKRLPPKPESDLAPPKFLTEVTDETPTATKREVAAENAVAKETQQTARKLLDSQRASVAMLSLVRERLESLDADLILKTLDKQGYWFTDTAFLQSPDQVDKMQDELAKMYESGTMAADMDRLGAGEYIDSLQGGSDQYIVAPRSIEWVVSTTKHLAGVLSTTTSAATNDSDNGNASGQVSLDDSRCMATARTFDRKTKQAALALLMGSDAADDDDDDSAAESVQRPFEMTVAPKEQQGDNKQEEPEDRRRISACYYLVPDDWSHGGDLTFESTGETVAAVRDRLVLWKSDETALRQEFWKGSDDMPLASCIELHLIQKA